MEQMIHRLSTEFALGEKHVSNVIALLDEGNTIPFVARYRKEMTGAMDDQVLRELSDRLSYLRNLDTRKEEVQKSIAEQGKMTAELERAISAAQTLAEVEDIYRPYKPKRKTRASVAREKGLEPLAMLLLEQGVPDVNPEKQALAFVCEKNGVETAQEALSGARDIIAEEISDDADIRKRMRALFWKEALLYSLAADAQKDSVYRMYYEFSDQVSKVQSHRILAINRGEREGFLKVRVQVDEEAAMKIVFQKFIRRECAAAQEVRLAARDGYSRLIGPSIEREVRGAMTEKADEQAIKMFALNLKPLLMQPPVKNKVTMGFDPGYRTGCKVAVIDETGKVLDTTVVYPTPPQSKTQQSARVLLALIKKHDVQVIAIGNGTASHESEVFISDLIRDTQVGYMVVSEAGASVYSASKLAAQEFPQFDVSLRSAVSIARRLQDPLAELVKIDPKSIGVGQYQHDMPPARLDHSLSGVVENCVNAVGIDLNTASVPLLARVAGISVAVAHNIVAYREKEGAFHKRSQLLKVPKLGAKAYEQCAGFLRVPESEDILDRTGVHPESYEAVKKILALCGCSEEDAARGNLITLETFLKERSEEQVARHAGVGVMTLRDIIRELQKPGRDPRDELPAPMLRHDILSMEDLSAGMELTGTVRNVVDFGAFVDIGVHQDGLVHISRMSHRYVRHPSEVVKTGDVVRVWVVETDAGKNRVSLTMISPAESTKSE